ncbi:DNA internalization-related competence protein ComEC/Rec2 [Massilia sp. TW-1]|uniref:DNA internalization-related competence protein ComEC/Rec2 n=1 Tax=Telluria antibiotica TaxID=2717319 RepID=A0ABX0PKK1_9BURK|nr:DNA internalization-related competence protein ComEC/Rec2 [Telluria antibiotica]NIA57871.1 DNA internalization-related competence protein ComEC/Rec2 [Telluria antibiotica]
MRSFILGFVAGATALQTAATLPQNRLMAACIAAALLLIAAANAIRPMAARIAMLVTAGLLTGCAWAAFVAQAALAPSLDARDEGRDVHVVGIVATLPYRFDEGVRFDFHVERSLDAGVRVPPHVVLSWYAGMHGAHQVFGDVQPGQRWQLTVRLQRPHGNANPGGFDYEAWLLEQGVRATGYVRAGDGDRMLDAFVASPGVVVERVRAALRTRIQHALAGRTYAGVIVALVIGDQRGIDQADWQVFNRTGIGHLISISGLHITMIAGLAAWSTSALWRRSFFTGAQLPLRLPAQKVAALVAAGVALLYVLLAGFGVPAQRTLYMLSVVTLALWLGRLTAVSHVLCAALGVVVLLDPWAGLWPGFWLSFGAVSVIVFAGHGRIGAPPAGARAALLVAGRTQWAVTAGLVPLTLLLFGQVSVVSPLANAVAIPLVSFVVTPLALAGSMTPGPPGDWLLLLAHRVVEMLAWLLRHMAGWPGAVWRAPAPQAWVFVLGLGGTLWMLMPRGWPHRWAGAVALLPMLLQVPDRPLAGTFRVTAFDVGQGMALLIETESHRLLYDTGPAYAPGADGGSRVILPYLRMRGIAALDGIVVSHGDTDHTGGALAVLEGVDAAWLASSLPLDHAIVRAARHHVRCAAGQHWEWDGITFDMLHPTQASYDEPQLKTNARSCTLRIGNGHRTLLLAGDIEAPQEAALLARARDRLRADVLLAPHHGSGTSSTPDFLDAVRPDVAIFQVGFRNRYRHPKPAVYARYGALGVQRLRTDDTGAIALTFDASVDTRTYRVEHARYWFGR